MPLSAEVRAWSSMTATAVMASPFKPFRGATCRRHWLAAAWQATVWGGRGSGRSGGKYCVPVSCSWVVCLQLKQSCLICLR